MAEGAPALMTQQRAQHALAVVNRAAASADAGKYRQHARQLGPAILINGLGQALATAAATADSQPLYRDLSEWLCDTCPWSPVHGASNAIAAIAEGDRASYMWAAEESLAWLEWVKKLAVAQIAEVAKP